MTNLQTVKEAMQIRMGQIESARRNLILLERSYEYLEKQLRSYLRQETVRMNAMYRKTKATEKKGDVYKRVTVSTYGKPSIETYYSVRGDPNSRRYSTKADAVKASNRLFPAPASPNAFQLELKKLMKKHHIVGG